MTSNSIEVKRVFVLDVLRILAFFWVLVYHYHVGTVGIEAPYQSFGNRTIPGFKSDSPIIDLLMESGYLGVDLFFIISGAVIFQSAANKSSFEFLVSRFARLAPAYLLAFIPTSLIYFFTSPAPISLQDIVNGLIFSQNSFGGTLVIAAGWTLYVEILFYFSVFILKLLLNLLNFFKEKETLQLHHVFLFLIGSFWLLGGSKFLILPNILIPTEYLGYFLAGASIPILYLQKSGIAKFLIFYNAILMLRYSLSPRLKPMEQSSFTNLNVDYFIQALFLIIFIFTVAFYRKTIKIIVAKILRIIAMSTYPLYLLHQQVGMFLAASLYSLGMTKIFAYCAAILSLISISIIFVIYIEPRLRKKITFDLLSS